MAEVRREDDFLERLAKRKFEEMALPSHTENLWQPTAIRGEAIADFVSWTFQEFEPEYEALAPDHASHLGQALLRQTVVSGLELTFARFCEWFKARMAEIERSRQRKWEERERRCRIPDRPWHKKNRHSAGIGGRKKARKEVWR
mgnify:CR=1 FL=1